MFLALERFADILVDRVRLEVDGGKEAGMYFEEDLIIVWPRVGHVEGWRELQERRSKSIFS